MTAARSLAKCDTWDFDRDSFVPFLPSAITEIVDLLGEVELADSQMRLNQTLGVVIDRVGSHVSITISIHENVELTGCGPLLRFYRTQDSSLKY